MMSMNTQPSTLKRLRDRLPLHGPALVLVPVGAAVGLLIVILIVVKVWPKEAPPTEVPPVPVEVLTILPIETFAETVERPGVVVPQRIVDVSAEVAGRVERIEVKEGQHGRKGQVMIALNTDLLSAAYRRAKADAEYNAKELQRIIELHRDNVAAASELDQIRAKAEASQATLAQAKAELERATIEAPIDGVIDRIHVEVGEYVQPGTPVARIVEVDTAKVVVDVPSRDIGYLKLHSAAQILKNPDGNVLTGTISYIGAVAEKATRTTPVEITVDNRDGVLHSGQIVTVRLTRRELSDVILVPLEAVIPLAEGKEVYVVEDGKAVSRRVTLGIMKGRYVQITSGLEAGDQLIVGGGQRYVGPGQAVDIVHSAKGETRP